VRFSHLVAELYRRGVSYWPTPDGRLHLEAPVGVLTGELRAAVEEHRDNLLFLSDRTPIMGRGRDEVDERGDQGDDRGDQGEPVTTAAANSTGAGAPAAAGAQGAGPGLGRRGCGGGG
jgi:hypothetical protein